MDFHEIWYADANGHPKLERVAKSVIFCKKKLAAAAFLDFGKMAINLLRMDRFL